jgi:hypothetical protein
MKIETQVIRRIIKKGVTAEGLLGRDRFKVWGAKGFTCSTDLNDEPYVVEFKTNTGWVQIFWKGGEVWDDGTNFHVIVFGIPGMNVGHQHGTVKGEQLAAVIDAVLTGSGEVVKVKERTQP